MNTPVVQETEPSETATKDNAVLLLNLKIAQTPPDNGNMWD